MPVEVLLFLRALIAPSQRFSGTSAPCQDWMSVSRVGSKHSMCTCESLACPPAALVDLNQVSYIVLSTPASLHANLGRPPTRCGARRLPFRLNVWPVDSADTCPESGRHRRLEAPFVELLFRL